MDNDRLTKLEEESRRLTTMVSGLLSLLEAEGRVLELLSAAISDRIEEDKC